MERDRDGLRTVTLGGQAVVVYETGRGPLRRWVASSARASTGGAIYLNGKAGCAFGTHV